MDNRVLAKASAIWWWHIVVGRWHVRGFDMQPSGNGTSPWSIASRKIWPSGVTENCARARWVLEGLVALNETGQVYYYLGAGELSS